MRKRAYTATVRALTKTNLNLLVSLLAHHDRVLEAEVQDDLGVDNPVARLVEGVLNVGVQEVQRLPRRNKRATSQNVQFHVRG